MRYNDMGKVGNRMKRKDVRRPSLSHRTHALNMSIAISGAARFYFALRFYFYFGFWHSPAPICGNRAI